MLVESHWPCGFCQQVLGSNPAGAVWHLALSQLCSSSVVVPWALCLRLSLSGDLVSPILVVGIPRLPPTGPMVLKGEIALSTGVFGIGAGGTGVVPCGKSWEPSCHKGGLMSSCSQQTLVTVSSFFFFNKMIDDSNCLW
jgi:hypothetical protein